MGLFHITTKRQWQQAVQLGRYHPPSLDREGFIHFSYDRQWLNTANRFFLGQPDLVLVSVRSDRLQAELRVEAADGDEFPHLYGELNLDAVVDVYALPLIDEQRIGIPPELLPWQKFFT